MKKMKKRTIIKAFSSLLAIAMIMSLLPAISPKAEAGFSSTASLTNANYGVTLAANTTYYVSGTVTISNVNTGGNAIVIPANSTVVIYIPSNCALYANGGNGSGQTGGGAGIYLPSSSTLIVTGGGYLYANGGSAGSARVGYSGSSGSINRNTEYMYSGAGGSGGYGAGGAGAGIGGSGGYGGSGGSGGSGRSIYTNFDSSKRNGNSGSGGGNGSSGTAMGTLYILGSVKVTANGGGKATGAGGGSAGSYDWYKWSNYYTAAGGGGGGGGGGASQTYDVGGGGGGGAGGGGGGGGATMSHTGNWWSHAGYGGTGGDYGYAYTGGTNGSAGSTGLQEGTAASYVHGGYAGASGTRGYSGSHGSIYLAATATLTGRTGASGYGASSHSAIQYTVTFDKQSGTGGSGSTTATLGAAMPSVSIPTRPGYTFTGYYTSGNAMYYNSNGTSARAWDMTYNTTLYAHWQAKTYTITYANNGGTQSKSGTASYNITNSLTMPTIYRMGYKFSGWKVTSPGTSGDTNWSSGSSYTGSVNAGMYGSPTLQAQWALESYQLSFNTNGGNETFQTGYYSYGSLLPTPTKKGYTFLGWKKGSSTSLITSVPDLNGAATGADLTTVTPLTAQWAITTYTVYFNTNGGENVNNVNYNINSTAITLPTPVRAGYTFAGWNVTMTAGSWNNTSETYQAGNLTLDKAYGTIIMTAKWTAQSYTIILNTDGGSTVSNVGYTKDTTTVALPAPTKSGYSFAGWKFTNVSGSTWSGDVIVGAGALNVSGKTGSVTLTAQWNKADYVLTLQANGGAISSSPDYTELAGGSYTRTFGVDSSFALPSPTRTGYTFGGWVDGSGTAYTTFATGHIGNITLMAKWTANTYGTTVTLDAKGGTVDGATTTKHPVTYDSFYGGAYTRASSSFSNPLPRATKDGNSFIGWFTDETGGHQITDFSVFNPADPSQAITLYAHWAEKPTVSVDERVQTYVYDGAAKPFEVNCNCGVDGFVVSYSLGGGATTGTAPSAPGSYDVTITRNEDDTYAGYTKIVSNGLVIEPAKILYSATDYNGKTGDTVSIVSVSAPASGYTVTYSGDADESRTYGEMPELSEGTTTVYYQISAENYETVTGSAEVTLTADGEKTAAPISLTSVTGVYDGTTAYEVEVTNNQGLTLTYKLDGGDAVDENPTVVNAGIHTVTVSFAGDDNYLPYNATATLSVTPKRVAIPSVSAPLGYNGSAQTMTFTGAGSSYYTIGGTTSGTAVGKYTATAALNDNANCVWSDGTTEEKTLPWYIAKGKIYVKADSQSIDYGDDPTKLPEPTSWFYSNQACTIASAITSGEYTGSVSVEYDYLCDYLRYDPVGGYRIIVLTSGLSSEKYDFIAVDGTLSVTAKPVALSWTGGDYTYDGKEKSVSAQVGGILNADKVTVGSYTNEKKTNADTYNASVSTLSGDNAGNYTLTSATGNSYSWTIARAAAPALKLVLKKGGATVETPPVYGETYTLEAVANTGSGGTIAYSSSDAGVEINGSSVTFNTTGSVTITATQGAGANYLGTTAVYTATPSRRELTITGVVITERMYDGTNIMSFANRGTLNISGAQSVADCDKGSNAKLTLVTAEARATTADSEAASNKPVTLSDYSLSGSSAENYVLIMPTDVKGTITAFKVDIPDSPTALTYNGAEQKPDIPASQYYEVSVEAKMNANEGGTAYTAKLTLNQGYKWADEQNGPKTLNWYINKAELTITPNATTITYGDDTSELNPGYSVIGLMGSDGSNAFSGDVSYTYADNSGSAYAPGSPISGDGVTYKITPVVTGLTANNYKFKAADAVLTVEKRTAQFSFSMPKDGDKNVVYGDGGSRAVGAAVSNKLESDDVTASVSVTKNGNAVSLEGGSVPDGAGEYVVTVNSISGGKAGNYRLPDSSLLTASFAIDKAPITVTALNRSITYGDSIDSTVKQDLWLAKVTADNPATTEVNETAYEQLTIEQAKGAVDENGNGVFTVVGIRKDMYPVFPTKDVDTAAIIQNVVYREALTFHDDGGVTVVDTWGEPQVITQTDREQSVAELIAGGLISVSRNVTGLEVSLSYDYTAYDNVGAYTITPTVTGEAGENFELQAVSGTLTVGSKSIAYPSLATKAVAYTGDVIDINYKLAELDTNGEPLYNLTDYDRAAMTLRSNKHIAGGNYELIVTLNNPTGYANYAWSGAVPTGGSLDEETGDLYLPYTITRVTQGTLAITTNASYDKGFEYGDIVPLTTGSTGAGTGAVTWKIIRGADICTLGTSEGDGSDVDLTITGIGDVIIQAIKQTDGNVDAETTTYEFTAVKRVLQPVLTMTNRIYDGTKSVAYTYAVDIGQGVDPLLDYSALKASVADKNAQQAKEVTFKGEVSIPEAAAAYYVLVQPVITEKTVDIAKKEVTVTAEKSITYGGVYNDSADIVWTGFITGEGKSLAAGRNKLGFVPAVYAQYSDAGDYNIVLTFDGAEVAEGSALAGLTATNYTFKAGDSRLTVKKLPVSLSWSATRFEFVEGTEREVTATVANAVNGDTVTIISYTGNTGTAEGIYTAKATGVSNTNYTVTGGSGISHSWVIGDAQLPGSGSAPAEKPAPVIIDGVEHDIGTVEKTETTTTVVVDHESLDKQIESANESVVVPVAKDTASAAAQLVVRDVEKMTANDMTLVVETGGVSYSIPAVAVDTKKLDEAFPEAATDEISFTVTISETAQTENDAAEKAVVAAGGELVLPCVDFEITAAYNGKMVTVADFGQFVSRSVEISAEQAKKITTAVVYDADGSLRHVPTQVYQSGGKWFARINSLTNSTYALISSAKSFADARGQWFEAVVNEMASRKIINGRSDASFDGNGAITRAEFASIAVRALGLPTAGEAKFSDVDKSAWYAGAVGTAAAFGLINGYEDGSFRPEAYISRQEAMQVIANAAKVAKYSGKTGTLAGFSDAGGVAAWARAAAQFNVGSGLIVGSNGNLNPTANITRAETATVVLRLLQNAGLIDIRTKA